MIILGIDPGKNGKAIVLNTEKNKSISIYSFDFDACNILDAKNYITFIQHNNVDCIFLEKVMGRGGASWGATNNFNFGMIYGQILLATKMAQKPMILITPQTWQKIIHKGIPTSLGAKEKTLAAYQNLFPHDPLPKTPRSKKTDNNLIDALMIALYGVLKNNGHIKKWELLC